MRCLVMFITAVCLLFLLKLKWPKNKSVYDKIIINKSQTSDQDIPNTPLKNFNTVEIAIFKSVRSCIVLL